MLHVNLIILHGSINNSNVNIIISHVHIDYLACRGRSMPPDFCSSVVVWYCHYFSDNYDDFLDDHVVLSELMSICSTEIVARNSLLFIYQ